jgi:Tfp pilus assembly protein PilF
MNKRLPPALLLIAVAGLFFSIFENGFLWHDKQLLESAETISFADVPEYFLGTSPAADGEVDEYYRPVARLGLLLDHVLWNSNPIWYHVEGAFLHFLVTLVFYRIVLAAFGDVMVAFFSSMLFAVHPISVEPVNFVSARGSLIGMLFLTASIKSLLNARGGKARWLLFSLLLFLLSMLSLESGIVLSFFLVAFALLSGWRALRAGIPVMFVFLLMTASYYLLLMYVHGEPSLLPGRSLDMEAVLSGLSEYLRLPLTPFSVHVCYEPGPVEVFSFVSIAVMCAAGALLAASVLPWTPGPVRAACIWILVCSIPLTCAVPHVCVPLSDSHIYMALPGFCLLAGWAIWFLYRRNFFYITILFVTILVILGTATYKQNILWKNNFLLFEDAIRKSPHNASAHFYLAGAHEDIFSPLKAIIHYNTSLRHDPENWRAYARLGDLYGGTGQFDQAISSYEKALSLSSEARWIHSRMGETYMDGGDLDMALDSYWIFLQHYPGDSDAHYKMAIAYERKGDYENSLNHFHEALSAKPSLAKARYDLARLYIKLKDLHNARMELRVALIIEPNYTEARDLFNEISGK